MFMIPMPPTTSEIDAIPPSSSVSVPLIDDAAVEQLGLVEDVEVGVVGRGELVAVAQERGDLRVRGGHVGRRRDADADRADAVAADEVLLHRRRSGTITWSSGSWNDAPPLGCRMPISVNGIPPIEISVPRSSASSPRVSAVEAPEDRHAQRRGRTLTSVRNVPCQTS